MYQGYFEEGDRCPKCSGGHFYYPPVENCSCHINSPCSACTDRTLICDKCDYEPDEPNYKEVPVTPFYDGVGILSREYKPKPLDSTKIDYIIKNHTHFSQICEGVYPEGTTVDQVKKVVNGSFGGRFEHFGNGTFKFIAYTD